MRKPTLILTCQCPTLPSVRWPRVSTTSNQSRLRRVLAARAMAFWMALSVPWVDEPTSSTTLYVCSLMSVFLHGVQGEAIVTASPAPVRRRARAEMPGTSLGGGLFCPTIKNMTGQGIGPDLIHGTTGAAGNNDHKKTRRTGTQDRDVCPRAGPSLARNPVSVSGFRNQQPG